MFSKRFLQTRLRQTHRIFLLQRQLRRKLSSSSSLQQTRFRRRLVDEIDLENYVNSRIDELYDDKSIVFFFFLLHVATILKMIFLLSFFLINSIDAS